MINKHELDREFPVFFLDAVLHEKLSTVTKVVSIHDMEYFLWVKVSPDIAKFYQLYEIDKVDASKDYDINIGYICTHDPNRIWYKFNTMMMDRSPGQHVYRMHMVNKDNNTTISLYFSYIVQREDTDKPYVYMNKPLGGVVKI